MSNSCLVLIVHGSKNPTWQVPFERLVENLRQDSGSECVHLCYMNYGQPSLRELTLQLLSQGVSSIRILPLFLAAGQHLREDIPGKIETLEREYPALQFELLPPLGQHPEFMQFMRTVAKQYISAAKAEVSTTGSGAPTAGRPTKVPSTALIV